MLKSNITYNIKRKLIGSPKFIFGIRSWINLLKLHRIIISIILLQIFCRRLKIESGIVRVKVGSPYDCLRFILISRFVINPLLSLFCWGAIFSLCVFFVFLFFFIINFFLYSAGVKINEIDFVKFL
jgi:hypothetical protein